ncbi:hypothetical protein [Streptomyces sp. NPDC058307]|uniref:hypothetical protein n=1 Tax=Streptomyces sp. NPDC058307 TaxID=3346439 RepID=UPI0036E89FD6
MGILTPVSVPFATLPTRQITEGDETGEVEADANAVRAGGRFRVGAFEGRDQQTGL